MKRKPDILIVLAALLGIGVVISSFSAAETPQVAYKQNSQIQVVTAK